MSEYQYLMNVIWSMIKKIWQEFESQVWSLNPGSYNGVRAWKESDFNFKKRFEDYELLNTELSELKSINTENITILMEVLDF